MLIISFYISYLLCYLQYLPTYLPDLKFTCTLHDDRPSLDTD